MSLDQVQGAAQLHDSLLMSQGRLSTKTRPHRVNPALRKARSELRLCISTSADISVRPPRTAPCSTAFRHSRSKPRPRNAGSVNALNT